MNYVLDIPGYEGRYFADRSGNIFSLKPRHKHMRKLRQYRHRDNYLRVILYDKLTKPRNWQVHRLIALTFIPNPLGCPAINHINSNRQDNNVENLEWCTYSQNTLHGIRHGNIKIMPAGELSFTAKLTNSDVRAIRARLADGHLSQHKIAKEFGISQATVSNIHRNKYWVEATP